jgi:autotransporter family porin
MARPSHHRLLILLLLAGAVVLAAFLWQRRRPGGPPARPITSHFETLRPGARLPSGQDCAARVRPEPREPVPGNAGANHAPGATVHDISGASEAGNRRLAPRIDGAFAGTTDEIVQWGACKWGFDEDIVRAVALVESGWDQAATGDFENGAMQSFGLLQIKRTVHGGTYPASRDSTAFNVDYALAWRRACFEGDFRWLKQKNPNYAAGDEWGCVGAWYSGGWYDEGARAYIERVRSALRDRSWTRLGAGASPP